MKTNTSDLQKLMGIIERDVLLYSDQADSPIPPNSGIRWLFDFRNIFLEPEHLGLIADLFWERFSSKFPFQIGGMETAAIPLIVAIILKGHEQGKAVNGFYIRKERKKTDLQKCIEGRLTKEPVVLVDDMINDGRTFNKSIEILRSHNAEIQHIFALVRSFETDAYDFLHKSGICLNTLFSISDFGLTKSPSFEKIPPPQDIFDIKWGFSATDPNLFQIIPKSTPVLTADRVFFGSDNGNLWALDRTDGSVVWKYKVGLPFKGRSILSSPLIVGNTICFGAFDGNLYALDMHTGKRQWVFLDADWIASSPTSDYKEELIFVGLEFGLFRKRGGVACIDRRTGKKQWHYIVPETVASSPLYIERSHTLIFGSDDGTVHCLDARTGAVHWSCATNGAVRASFTYDHNHDQVIFGSYDHTIYFLDAATGNINHTYMATDKIHSTPVICDGEVYISGIDKCLYCLDAATAQKKWSYRTEGRLFAEPVIVDGRIYVGSCDGRLYELNRGTGKLCGSFQTPERIVNRVIYDSDTKEFFLLNFANELYCLTRRGPQPS